MTYNYGNTKYKKIYYIPRKAAPAPENESMLLSKAIDGFILTCRARRLSEHTISDYAYTFRIFLSHMGDMDISRIESSQITAFLASRRVGAKTVLNYHIGLSALWTWAIKEGYADKHVVHMVTKPKPKKVVIKPFSEIEVRAMFNGIRMFPERDRAIILLLLDTGLRASELVGLEKNDIDLAERRLKVLGKGNKERFLPFSSRTFSAVFKYLATLKPGEKPFPFSRTSLGHHIATIGDRVGVDAHPHRFRHTFAVTFLRNGGDPYTLQEMLGHSTMEMVRIYLVIAQVDIDSAHRKASPVENWKL